MYLFYDTETTGVDTKTARIVQFAAVLCYPDGREAQSFNLIALRTDPIPAAAAAVHGITTEINQALGIDEGIILSVFEALLKKATVAVAYNDRYDVEIITNAFRRMDGEKADPFAGANRLCAMKFVGDHLNGGARRVSLTNAHRAIFSRDFEGAHNALGDVIAMKDCFFHVLDAMKAKRAMQGGAP